MMSYERKRLLFHELVERRSREGRFKFTREERSLLGFFGLNIKKLQAVVRCYSKHCQYGRARKAVTAMQASYIRMPSLNFCRFLVNVRASSTETSGPDSSERRKAFAEENLLRLNCRQRLCQKACVRSTRGFATICLLCRFLGGIE